MTSAPPPSWCCQLCDRARLRPRALFASPDLLLLRRPTFSTLSRFELDPRPSEREGALPGYHRLPHGPLWHAALARFLGCSPEEIAKWCAAPERLGQSRSRAIAHATGLPLELLRPEPPKAVE